MVAVLDGAGFGGLVPADPSRIHARGWRRGPGSSRHAQQVADLVGCPPARGRVHQRGHRDASPPPCGARSAERTATWCWRRSSTRRCASPARPSRASPVDRCRSSASMPLGRIDPAEVVDGDRSGHRPGAPAVGQPRGRHRAAGGRGRGRLSRPRRARARRRRPGGRATCRSPSTSSAPICCRSAATSWADPPARARCWCDAACACRPLLVGGDQERARRAGLENVPALIGPGRGVPGAHHRRSARGRGRRGRALTDRVLAAVPDLDRVHVYGDPVERLPHLVCLGIDGIEPQAVLLGLDQAGIAAHSGSACASEGLEDSPVLEAMGVDAHRSLRISVGLVEHRRRHRRAARRAAEGDRPTAGPRRQRVSPATLPLADGSLVRAPSASTDDITRITEPHVHPFLRCNVWHVRGPRPSTWWSTRRWGCDPLRHLVERELPGPLLAMATHAHSDHVGDWRVRRARHPRRRGRDGRPRRVGAPSVAPPLRGRGARSLPPGRLRDRAAARRRRARTPTSIRERGRDRRRPGHPGPGRRRRRRPGRPGFEVLHLPGHSPGSIGLWEAGHRACCSPATPLYDGPLLDQLDGSDIDAYVRTMSGCATCP